MKRLWTSCYSRTRSLPEEFVQVQTSRSAPTWWSAKRQRFEHELAPNNFVFAMAKHVAGADWKAAYRRQIQELFDSGRLTEIINALPPDSVLLCWEHDPADCHRSVLGEFIKEKGLADVLEYPYVPRAKREPTKRKRQILI